MLIDTSNIKENQSCYCPGCNGFQYTLHKNALQRTVAFSISALIMMILANAFPFLTFEAQGQTRVITVVQAAGDLMQQEFLLIAFLVFAFVLVLPFIYLTCIFWLTLPLILGCKPIGPVLMGRLMSYFLPWVMAEVFIVAVLVALVKVISMADIIFGFSFWAYIGFVVFFLLTASTANRHQLWLWIDYAKK